MNKTVLANPRTNFGLCLIILNVLAAIPTRAATIPGLFNTGVDSFGVPLADDAIDFHYSYMPIGVFCAHCPFRTVAATGGAAGKYPIPPWLGDGPLSAWVSPTTDTFDRGSTDGSATHFYEVEFDLTGFSPATASITGQWAADDKGLDILINGVSTGQRTLYGATNWTRFQITSGFVAGKNKLTFLVNNDVRFWLPPKSPTGLRVEMNGTALLTRPIRNLFNTGVDAAGVPQADDAKELHYRLVGGSAVLGVPIVATVAGGFPIGPWISNEVVSAWIAPSRSTYGPNETSGAPNYFYETRFDLSGLDPATAEIHGQWATDNAGIDILINGMSTGQANTTQFTSWTPFRITNGFRPGINILTFVVNNGAGETSTNGPTGLRVEMSGSAVSDCTDLQNAPPGIKPNPWYYRGLSFFGRDFTGSALPNLDVRTERGFTGLYCGSNLEVSNLNCGSIEVTLVTFAQPAIVTTYDQFGNPQETKIMSVGQAVAETMRFRGQDVVQLVVYAPADETFLLDICCLSEPDCPWPVIQCADREVECGSSWSFIPPPVLDECCLDPGSARLVSISTNSTICPQMLTAVWEYVDCRQRTATCSQVIYLRDNTPPIVICAPDKMVPCDVPWSFDPPLAYDACCGTNVIITPLGPPVTNRTACPLIIAQAWAITDCCSNTVYCMQRVTVMDTNPPVIICPANMEVKACGTNPVVVCWTLDASAPCGTVAGVASWPPSGSTFQPNTTNIVTAWAWTPCLVTNFCTFTVVVTTAQLNLTITHAGGNITLHWTDGILQEANAVTGPYTDVPNAMPPAYTVSATKAAAFYRLRCHASAGTSSSVVTVANDPGDQTNPHVSGNLAVYTDSFWQSIRYYAFSTSFQPLAGGTEAQLALPGWQAAPSIKAGVIAFESFTLGPAADIYVYIIATDTLLQLTDTPNVGETLDDIDVLPNGDIRVIWVADDGPGGELNIYARTFTPPSSCDPTGLFLPVPYHPTLNRITAGKVEPIRFFYRVS